MPNSKQALAAEEPCETETITPDPAKTRRTRQVVTKETVEQGFEDIVTSITEELQRIKQTREPVPRGTTKFLRGIAQKLKQLSKHATRVMKQKTAKTRKTTSNCGFEKPVTISTELAKFCQWSADDLKSRVDVTKYICKYIEDHNLQNPDDRRQILPDNKLKKLLGYDPKKQDVLRYYDIQSCLKQKNHFPK